MMKNTVNTMNTLKKIEGQDCNFCKIKIALNRKNENVGGQPVYYITLLTAEWLKLGKVLVLVPAAIFVLQ